MNSTRPETVRAVAAAISRAEIHDDRMTSDPNRIKAWADTCEEHGIDDTALACRTVDQYYTRENPDTLRVGAFIAVYRKLRGEQAEKEKAEDLPELAPPDPQSMGLGLHTTGDPIWSAYDQHGAIDIPCETCGAGEREACVNVAINLTRRIPCTSRLKAGFRGSRRGAAA